MVLVLLKDGSLYQFHNAKQAALWLKEHPDSFSNDMDNVVVLNDKKFSDIPIIEYIQTLTCGGCESEIKFSCANPTPQLVVICPVCQGRNHL